MMLISCGRQYTNAATASAGPALLRSALEDVELKSGRVIRKGEYLALDLARSARPCSPGTPAPSI